MKKLFLLIVIAASLVSCHKADIGEFVTVNKTYPDFIVYSAPPTVLTSTVIIYSKARDAGSTVARVNGGVKNNFIPGGTQGNVTLTLQDSKGMVSTVKVDLPYPVVSGTYIPFTVSITNMSANIESISGVLWTN